MSEKSPLESRLIEVEFQLMHLQRDFDELNAECLRQQALIKDHQRRIESLERLLREGTRLGDSSAEGENKN